MSLISHPARPLLGLAVVAALAGCAATATKPTAVEANITTKAVGYLDKSAVPASLDLVPAPPVAVRPRSPWTSRSAVKPARCVAARASPRPVSMRNSVSPKAPTTSPAPPTSTSMR